MTQGNCQCISTIEVLPFNYYAKSFLYHQGNLLFGSSAVSAYGNLGLARSIFADFEPVMPGRCDCHALGSSQLEHHLGIFSHKGRFHSETLRRISRAERIHKGVNPVQLGIGIGLLVQIEDSGIHKLRLALLINTHEPETKEFGSGVDA